MITREEAATLMESKIKNINLRKHIYAVEAGMIRLAEHFGEDVELWGLTGLLHDLDYDKTVDKEIVPKGALAGQLQILMEAPHGMSAWNIGDITRIVYIVVGLAHGAGRLPVLGRRLPLQLRYLISIAVIGLAFFLLAYLVMANRERAMELAPQYQQSLLAAIQRVAVYFGFETEPTWATLRRDLLAQIDLQRMLGSLLASVGSMLVTFVVVCLYATFLLLERRSFEVSGASRARSLPERLELKLYTAQSEIVDERRGAIRFYPDGSSTAEIIDITQLSEILTWNPESSVMIFGYVDEDGSFVATRIQVRVL